MMMMMMLLICLVNTTIKKSEKICFVEANRRNVMEIEWSNLQRITKKLRCERYLIKESNTMLCYLDLLIKLNST
jgi:hypothetical protein